MPNRSNTLSKSTTKILGYRLSIFLAIVLLISCKSEKEVRQSSTDFDLSIRLAFDPDRINPMLSRQVHASQIEGMIFLPLADYNPRNLRLEPILIKESPKISEVDPLNEAGGFKYEMEIMDEAIWDNGDPITGYDYEFTMKAALDPYLVNTTWRDQMGHIREILVDPDNPKKITVITNVKYILSEEVITTNDIYPEHIYDPEHLLKEFSFRDIKEFGGDESQKIDTILHRFADQFNDEKYSRSLINGGGPYQFEEWIPNQQIVLQRKENWWGSQFKEKHPCFEAYPSTITYYIIPDAQTALTALKDFKVDLVANLSPEQYRELEEYNSAEHPFTLEAPAVLQYYFIAYNNDKPALQDKNVRKAISLLMDIENLTNKLFFGLATRTVGPLPPQHEAYNHNLEPLPFDPEESKRLLTEAGWQDTNGDGILDKVINGEKIQLQLDILTTRSQLSQDVAIILKSEAEKIGIGFNIIPNDVSKLIEETGNGSYDLSCLASVQSIGPYDPYNFWHSDKAGPGGTNYFNFRNAEADSLIEKIRVTLDTEERNKLYLRFQEILYNEQAALFLVAPKTPVAVRGNLNFTSTTLRPGYFENTIFPKN